MNVKELKAKSEDSISLIDHSKKVANLAFEVGQFTLSNALQEERYNLLKETYLSGLLHDIGKATKGFQEILNNPKKQRTGYSYLHNEISWAFLKNYLRLEDTKDSDLNIERILRVVHWHHGIIRGMNQSDSYDILNSLNDGDINQMKDLVKELLGHDYLYEDELDPLHNPYGDESPNYYIQSRDENSKLSFIRSNLVSADYHYSHYTIEGLQEKTKRYNKDRVTIDAYGNDRFRRQRDEIVPDCVGTTMCNGPTAFGKTMVGLLTILNNSDERGYWVTPRIDVCHSSFKSITKELYNVLGMDDISVELVIGNEIIKWTHDHKKGKSDIVVCTIDSFLKPSIGDSDYQKDQYLINNCTVVFDEFHEFMSETALFSAFVNLVYLRHNLTDSNTLLLSGTPNILNELWDTPNNKTNIKPNQFEHYDPPHNVPFYFEVIEGESPKAYEEKNSLVIFNSVTSAQSEYSQGDKDNYLIHSLFKTDKRREDIDNLINEYGDSKIGVEDKPNIIGTHVIQASLDISLKHLSESVISPEASIQRGGVGRKSRYGEYRDSVFRMYDDWGNKSERSTIQKLYNKDLRSNWIEECKGISGRWVTPKEFINLYNKFNRNYYDKLYRYIIRLYKTSLKNLSDVVFPKRNLNQKGKSDSGIIAGSNKLRLGRHEVFTIMKKSDGSGFVEEPFSREIYNSFGDDFSEDSDIMTKMKKAIRELSENDYDYEFQEVYRNFHNMNIDKLRKKAQNSKTPYIRFDVLYDDELGVIKKPTEF